MTNYLSTAKENYLKKCERKFKKTLEEDLKNNLIEKDIYELFQIELQYNNLDFIYGLYVSYLITRKES